MNTRLSKLNEKFWNPQGRARWNAFQIAKAVRRIIIADLGDAPEVTITESECEIIQRAAATLGAPGVGFNPFRGGRAFGNRTMIVSAVQIRTALGA